MPVTLTLCTRAREVQRRNTLTWPQLKLHTSVYLAAWPASGRIVQDA